VNGIYVNYLNAEGTMNRVFGPNGKTKKQLSRPALTYCYSGYFYGYVKLTVRAIMDLTGWDKEETIEAVKRTEPASLG